MRYQLTDGNVIIATPEFVAQHYPDAVLLPEPVYPEPPIVPQSCNRRQGRLALLQYDLLDAVETTINNINDPLLRKSAQIEYEADTWERSNTTVQNLWAQLGGTEEELDGLFQLAVTF